MTLSRLQHKLATGSSSARASKRRKTTRNGGSDSSGGVLGSTLDRRRIRQIVDDHLDKMNQVTAAKAGKRSTKTLGGWCLIDGLSHVASAHGGKLAPLIERHGPPAFYFSDASRRSSGSRRRDDTSTFRSLCRIVAGQQLAGNAARTIWRRLLATVGGTEEDPSNLTPDAILAFADEGEDAVETKLRGPAGLSRAKSRSVVDLARHYRMGNLSDDLLMRNGGNDCDVRSLLLSVKGIGPWSCDMFLLFHCHKPNVLPLGDLAVRKGTASLFNVKGNGRGGSLCEKKDSDLLRKLHEPFAPYQSLSSYYMYKCSGMAGET